MSHGIYSKTLSGKPTFPLHDFPVWRTLTNFVNYRWASSQGIVEIGLIEIQYGCCQKSSRAYLCHVYWEYKYYPSQIELVGRRPAPFLRLLAMKSYEFGTQSTSKRYTSIRSLCRTKTPGFSQIFNDTMSLFRCFLCLPSLLFCSKKTLFCIWIWQQPSIIRMSYARFFCTQAQLVFEWSSIRHLTAALQFELSLLARQPLAIRTKRSVVTMRIQHCSVVTLISLSLGPFQFGVKQEKI